MMPDDSGPLRSCLAIPAYAGIQEVAVFGRFGIPAFAGMTVQGARPPSGTVKGPGRRSRALRLSSLSSRGAQRRGDLVARRLTPIATRLPRSARNDTSRET